jgi:cyclopropane fatty-acyl-phospholipid synthase-like methyltransferase
MTKIITDYPIAHESPDHIEPYGTKQDNCTSHEFIQQLEMYFGRKISLLDLGCAGGQFVVDMLHNNNFAIGLEGSDYSIKHNRPNWPEFNNKNMFTCDISKPFSVVSDEFELLKFDCITAWDVLEHIPESRLSTVFTNILSHINIGGLFVGHIASWPDGPYHVSLFNRSTWMNEIFPKQLKEVIPCPFTQWVRGNDILFCHKYEI